MRFGPATVFGQRQIADVTLVGVLERCVLFAFRVFVKGLATMSTHVRRKCPTGFVAFVLAQRTVIDETFAAMGALDDRAVHVVAMRAEFLGIIVGECAVGTLVATLVHAREMFVEFYAIDVLVACRTRKRIAGSVNSGSFGWRHGDWGG